MGLTEVHSIRPVFLNLWTLMSQSNTSKFLRHCILCNPSEFYRISALRVACSYRTVACDVICVISCMIPIELIAQEQVNPYAVLHAVERENAIKKMVRSLELVNWWALHIRPDPWYQHLAEQKTWRTELLHDTDDKWAWVLQGVFIPI